MAWASSPTAVSPPPPGQRRSTRSTWRAFTSWYSSTSTWSNSPDSSRRPTSEVPSARTSSSRSSKSQSWPARLRAVYATKTDRMPSVCSAHHGNESATTTDNGTARLATWEQMADRVSFFGKRARPDEATPRSWRTMPIRSVASAASRRLKPGSSPIRCPWWRRSDWARAWKVPPTTRPARSAPLQRPARSSISAAARREKVTRQTRSGAAPSATRRATRAARVAVLPVPAPARTRSGRSSWSTAARCCGFMAPIANICSSGYPTPGSGGRASPAGRSLDGDALGQVPRAVDVAAEGDGRVVGEELEGDPEEDRVELGLVLRHDDHVLGGLRDGAVGHRQDRPAAGPDLGQRAQVLLEQLVVGDDGHRRQPRPDEGERPVLELGRRVRLGVEVADLLQLLGALPGHRDAAHPAHVHGAVVPGQVRRQVGELLLVVQDLADLIGQGPQSFDDPPPVGQGEVPDPPQVKGQQGEGHGGGAERLGRGHRDLWPGVEVDAAVALAGERAADDVDDPEHPAAPAPQLLDGGQGVVGLARLAHRHVEGPALDDRVAVAELGGRLGVGRDAGQLLDELGAELTRVEGGAAPDDLDPVDLAALGGRQLEPAEVGGGEPLVDAPEQRPLDRLGLLEDLLVHVVSVGAELVGGGVDVDGRRGPGRDPGAEVGLVPTGPP